MVFLSFVQTAHYWTKTHPELALEEDVEQLLATHTALAECLLNDPAAGSSHTPQQLLDELDTLRAGQRHHYELEQALHKSERRFREMIDSLPTAIYTTDAQNGAFVHVRPVIGRKLDEAMRILWPEEIAAEIIANFRRTLETGEPYHSRDFVNLRADKEQVEGYEWQLHQTTLPDGRKGVICYYFDSTALRDAERRTRESEQRYRLATRATRDVVWDWDMLRDEMTWSEALHTVFGYPPQEAGRVIHDAFQWWTAHLHPDDRERVGSSFKAASSAGEDNWIEEYRFLRADGSYANTYGAAFIAYDEERKPIRLIGAMTDITERHQFEQRLKEADRRKDEFLGMLAHELRNPLAPIRTGLHLMQAAGDNRQLIEECQAIMQRQLEYMVRLIDDLMDVSRISRGKISLRRERIELAPIVHTAVEGSRPLIETNKHTLTINIPPEPIYINADATRLAQVIGNLLTNAAKYTQDGGHIELAVERQGDQAIISVKDNGQGIAPSMLTDIFELFMQVDWSVERSQGGLGIGLTLVKNLVELHGGTVEARSSGAEQGSEFIVRLPTLKQAPQRPQEPADDGQEIAPRRILVVDDNVDAADSLAMLLKQTGHEVHIAYDGPKAIELAAKVQPGVILLDIGMPGLSGYDVCRRIREQAWGKEVFIIALTGRGQPEDRQKSHKAGFNAHLVKPVDHAKLAEQLVGVAV